VLVSRGGLKGRAAVGLKKERESPAAVDGPGFGRRVGMMSLLLLPWFARSAGAVARARRR